MLTYVLGTVFGLVFKIAHLNFTTSHEVVSLIPILQMGLREVKQCVRSLISSAADTQIPC